MLVGIPAWSLWLMAGILGAILGSFANVCIIRMPAGESVVWPPSHCPLCDRRLTWWENIPVLSFILLLGRCRKCRAPISLQYPIVEGFCIVLSLITWWRYPDPAQYLVYFCLLVVPLVIVSFIDLKHMIIPDIISIPGILVGAAAHIIFSGRGNYAQGALDSLIGALIGSAFLFLVARAYEKLKKQEGLGFGDVKLIAMLGAFFGWRAALLILLLGSVLGSVVGIVLVLILRKDMKYAIPFGPFLAGAGLIQLFIGPDLLFWYMGLIRHWH